MKNPVLDVAAVVIALGAALFGCSGEVLVEHESGSAAGGQGGSTTGWGSATSSPQGSGGSGGQAITCEPPWGHVLGGPSSQYARSVAVDGEGSILTSTRYLSGLRLDGVQIAGAGEDGFAITKLDASGALLWNLSFADSSLQDEPWPLAADASNNVILGGSFLGTVDLGEGVHVTNPAGARAALVVKLDAKGHPLWARGFPAGARVTSLGINGGDNLFLSGPMNVGSEGFGLGPLQGDIFLAKLDSTGKPLWAKAFTGAVTGVRAFTVTSSGAVVLAGSIHDGSVDFGGGPLTSYSGEDGFVVAFDGAGHHVFSERFAGSGLQTVDALAVDALGNIVIAGTFSETVSFGGATLESPSTYSAYVARLDPSGKHLWSKRLSGDGDTVLALAILPSGDVLAAGVFHGPLEAGCGPVTSGPQDVLSRLVWLDSAGACVSYEGFSPSSKQVVNQIAVAGPGHIAMIGGFGGPIDLGGGTVVNDGNDSFVATLAACGP